MVITTQREQGICDNLESMLLTIFPLRFLNLQCRSAVIPDCALIFRTSMESQSQSFYSRTMCKELKPSFWYGKYYSKRARDLR